MIVAQQMKDAVQDHVTQFIFVGVPVLPGLTAQHLGAKNQFTQTLFIQALEAENIGGVVFSPKLTVESPGRALVQKNQSQLFREEVGFHQATSAQFLFETGDPVLQKFPRLSEGAFVHDQ